MWYQSLDLNQWVHICHPGEKITAILTWCMTKIFTNNSSLLVSHTLWQEQDTLRLRLRRCKSLYLSRIVDAPTLPTKRIFDVRSHFAPTTQGWWEQSAFLWHQNKSQKHSTTNSTNHNSRQCTFTGFPVILSLLF